MTTANRRRTIAFDATGDRRPLSRPRSASETRTRSPLLSIRRLVLSATFALSVACSLFGPDPDALDRFAGLEGDAASRGDADAGRPCVPARPPGPPPNGGGGTSENSFAVVVSALEFLQENDPRAFDLDDRCTCLEPPSCTGAPSAPPSCDGERGIDNKLVSVLAGIPGADEQILRSEKLKERLASGELNLVLHVTKYNGAANDDDVGVYLIRSPGTKLEAGISVVPRFDGTDPFDCAEEDVVLCDSTALVPRTTPLRGHVRDGVLIVPNADFYLNLFAGYPIRARGLVTAKIERFEADGSGEPRYSLKEGVLAGAVPVADILAALSLMRLGSKGTVCDNPQLLDLAVTQLCAARDLTFAGPADAGGATCDAVSTALGFSAVPFAPHDKRPLVRSSPCLAPESLRCEP